MTDPAVLSRRRVFASALSLAALGAVRPVLAATLLRTPAQTAGPFYPRTIPLDADNDLVQVAGRGQPAAGHVTHVMGRILDDRGRPVRGARVEIWQCDAMGYYHHPRDRRGEIGGDPNFQAYGHMTAGDDGAYRFRTIKPVPYPGRTPHIHFAVSGPGFEGWTTQMYVAGEPLNDGDFVLNRVRDSKARARLIVPLDPAPAIEPGALAGTFDIVLGGVRS
jgi:protocatechuate 3,4-dioxygenase beta subunit